ncbi:MAG: PAS domain-containing sensor histidine kinase [Alphaproteobacteria bacterium]|nr:MAG: PAS domain-containing sensor histidine kinase [Alphaproteobacteria bacterium]
MRSSRRSSRAWRSSLIRRHLRRLLRSDGGGLAAVFEWTVWAAALVFGVLTYVALVQPPRFPTAKYAPGIGALLVVDLVILLLLLMLTARRIVRLWLRPRTRGQPRALHTRLVAAFALFAGVPAIATALMSALFLQYGLQNWFSDTVRQALSNSLEVAEAYIHEHQENITLDLLAMAKDLDNAADQLAADPALLRRFVEEQGLLRSLKEAIVFDGTGRILAKYSLGLDLATTRVPRDLLERAATGEAVVMTDPDSRQVQALVKLRNFFNTYLFVSHAIDPKVLGYVEAARSSVRNYQSLETERARLQLRANAVFILFSLLLIVLAIWVGLTFANRLVRPVDRLVEAAGRVARGQYDVHVEGARRADEVGLLVRAFNRMTRQIAEQRRELVAANRALAERRHFLEALLAGVSAGVIGTDEEGRIHVVNRSACEILQREEGDLTGREIAEVLPAAADLLARVRSEGEEVAQDQITQRIGRENRMLLVRVTPQRAGRRFFGHVLTFDDVTDQIRDQRAAAWADVARRIAHEIKNPLTPIQLSAERLKRRYLKEIASDPEVFARCIETIIRQVEDLRRMVDEFSAFARMPAARLKREDLGSIVRQAVFLQQMGAGDGRIALRLPAGPVEVACDARLVGQAVTNLVKNALEAIDMAGSSETLVESEPAVEVVVTDEGDRVTIAVRDRGPGLPDDPHRLVEPYVTTRRKGTGLGLAIVKRIMEEHGGRLILRNRDGGGAEAIIIFVRRPAEKGAQTAGGEGGRERPAGGDGRQSGNGRAAARQEEVTAK